MEAVQVDESKQILVSLSRLEENVKNMNTKIDSLNRVSELALQTDQSVKSAHNRIDDLKKDFEDKLKAMKEDYEEKIKVLKEDQQETKGHITWLWRAVGTAALGFIFSVILFFMNRSIK